MELNNSMKHYGILGMKWGIRRQRGPDGRVTNKKELVSKDHATRKSLRDKKVSQMSNAELQEYINRLNLEKRYSTLRKQDVSRGEALVRKTLSTAGSSTLAEFVNSRIGKREFTIKPVIEDTVRSIFNVPEEKKKK